MCTPFLTLKLDRTHTVWGVHRCDSRSEHCVSVFRQDTDTYMKTFGLSLSDNCWPINSKIQWLQYIHKGNTYTRIVLHNSPLLCNNLVRHWHMFSQWVNWKSHKICNKAAVQEYTYALEQCGAQLLGGPHRYCMGVREISRKKKRKQPWQ